MKIKQTIKKMEEEIKFFGGKDFDKRNDVDLTDEGDLTATLKQAKLSGYKLALKDVLSGIDEKIIEFKQIKAKIPKKYKNVESNEKNQELRLNASLATLEELKKPIQEVLK